MMSGENGIITQYIDGIPCRTKEPFDFSFLKEYGEVFKVFDEQDSGCVCFGVSNGTDRYFIKFAGVMTMKHHRDSHVGDAVARLKAAVPKYIELAHPLLIHFVEAKEAGGGFLSVSEWFDGESFSIEVPPLYEKYLALPPDIKISIYERILQFHRHVAERGYVAMDFNDYSTLYNFQTGEVKICDIDFYAKQSYMNGTGRIFGISALMAPEEYRISGLIDEVTNVYTMGAVAFVLLANGDRSPGAWPLNAKSYDVLTKSMNDTRKHRQQSIAQLIQEWNESMK